MADHHWYYYHMSEVRDADRMKHDDMLGQVQLEKLGFVWHGGGRVVAGWTWPTWTCGEMFWKMNIFFQHIFGVWYGFMKTKTLKNHTHLHHLNLNHLFDSSSPRPNKSVQETWKVGYDGQSSGDSIESLGNGNVTFNDGVPTKVPTTDQAHDLCLSRRFSNYNIL